MSGENRLDRVVSPPRNELGSMRPPLEPGERLVFDFFDERLPDGWEIYLQPYLNGLRPDVVLLHPNVGIAVFEVKDWDLQAMHYAPADGRNDAYLRVEPRSGRPYNVESPLSQVLRYRRELVRLYLPTLGMGKRIVAVTAGVIVTTADTDEVRELMEPGLARLAGNQHPYTPVAGRDLLLAGALDEVFPESRRTASFHMTSEIAADLRPWLVEPQHARDQRRPLTPDGRQRELIEDPNPPVYRRVRGPAGSGKSLVLAARAAKLSNDGKSVLVVTFNHTLRNYLADLLVRAGGSRNKVTWLGFHEWCRRTMEQAGRAEDYRALWEGQASGSGTVLDDELAEATIDAIRAGPLSASVATYDAILVDEGQDFRLSWWAALREVRRPSGEMLLIADRAQDIYGRRQYWTEQAMEGSGFRGRWNELDISYRMPPTLTRLVRDFREQFLPLRDELLPESRQQEELFEPQLRWRQVPPVAAVEACIDELDAVVTGGAYSDVCIVATSKSVVLDVVSALRARNIQAISTVDPKGDDAVERQLKQYFFRGDGRIKVTTVHSFKGWESPRLIVVLDNDDPALTYTALSRLSSDDSGSALSVVCSVEDFGSYGATWPA